DILGEHIPALQEPMVLADSYRTTERNWDIQLQGERLQNGEGTRWALSWKASGSSNDWFHILRPQILGVGDKTHVRFVCENVDVQTEEVLSVFLVLDDQAVMQSESWLQILEELIDERAARNAETEVFALRLMDDEWMWDGVEEALKYRDFGAMSVSFEARAFDASVAQALQLVDWETVQSNALVLVLSGEGAEDEPITDTPLPSIPEALHAARMIVASPTSSPFRCTTRMTESRRHAVKQLVHWGYARHLGNCPVPEGENDLFD